MVYNYRYSMWKVHGDEKPNYTYYYLKNTLIIIKEYTS